MVSNTTSGLAIDEKRVGDRKLTWIFDLMDILLPSVDKCRDVSMKPPPTCPLDDYY